MYSYSFLIFRYKYSDQAFTVYININKIMKLHAIIFFFSVTNLFEDLWILIWNFILDFPKNS